MEAKFDRATPVLGPTELGKPNNRELLVEDLTEIPELWRRSADGAGIERTFKFKSFQAAWKFMNDVAAEAKRLRHHPEWSNIYNTVFIRWSTHDIGGLSSQDTQLARICDELASPTLTESTERSEQTRTLDDLCGLVEKVGQKPPQPKKADSMPHLAANPVEPLTRNDGLSPAHPFFEDAARIEEIVRTLKEELLDAILSGCTILLQRDPRRISFPILCESLKRYRSLWKAIISVQKYGVIYLANRAEARTFHPLYLAERNLAAQIDLFLQEDCNFHRAVNYAVYCFINKESNKVIYPPKLVPPNAISSIGFRHFAVREKDFTMISSEALLDDTSVLWDLHDFAHQTTASLSPALYGSKYFSHLQFLPFRATALIRSPGFRTAEKGPKISDGLVFSELLTGLYTAEVENALSASKQHTYASLERTLATAVADYLLGKRSLLHPSTGKMLQVDTRISVPQLAMLVQNKAYELTASEIEQRVFTRGGPEGDRRDVLDKMDTGQRLEALAKSRNWMYFEVRNTVKHRAHKAAYRQVAETYQAQSSWHSPDDAKLLSAIFSALDYEGWEGLGPPSLWALVAELRCFEPQEATASSAASDSSSWHDMASGSDITTLSMSLTSLGSS